MEPVKVKSLIVLLSVVHIVVLVIITIMIYWSMRMNEIRLSDAIEQNKRLGKQLSMMPKIKNSGIIGVAGNLSVR